MAFDDYVALSSFKAGGREYVRGEPVDDEMENFFILTDLNPKRAAHRATPEGKAAIADYEATHANAGEATPEAEELATELGVDLSKITGSGEGGRILIGDVEEAHKQNKRDSATEAARQEM